MKKILTLACFASTLSTAIAQKEASYEKLYYKDFRTETNELTITLDNAVSTKSETKFKLKINNKTNNYIIYKPEESKFVINGKEFVPNEKWVIISPNESESKTINLKGEQYNTVKNYSFVADGLYKVSIGTEIAAPDFKIPASQNDFKVGANFNCSLDKLIKETDKTEVKFNCSYNGDKIGFILPSKVAVKMPDGNEYANAKSRAKVILLMNGESRSFILQWDRMQGGKKMDMQKVDMMIKWHDAFTEGTPEKVKSAILEIQFDEATSNVKGK